ncbi:MAG TPA: IS110 family transposase, partial [Candidatus Accumulibacter phosphatis]|nr:IS110 family transposase [Candidatus Accumulibacter phosphatis]
ELLRHIEELEASIARFDARLLYQRAIVALAHKMLRTIFFMLKRGEYYRDSATNYEQISVQRNASRWIKALTRFGFIPAAA